jgi:hypothetical protein
MDLNRSVRFFTSIRLVRTNTMYTVGYESGPLIWVFQTLAEAEAWIEQMADVDPVGVFNGKYYIDGPCEE